MSSTSNGPGGPGRHRDRSRDYASGSAKRKAKELRVEREALVMRKIPKITQLFAPIRAPTAAAAREARHDEHSDTDDSDSSSVVAEPEATDDDDEAGEDEGSESDDVRDDEGGESDDDDEAVMAERRTDLGVWPDAISDTMREHWAREGSSECQHADADFGSSATQEDGEKYGRQCQKVLFTYTHPLTKQTTCRNWLCYSVSQGALYCFACKLMTDATMFGKQGFDDWKHASQSIPRHEKSSVHREAMVALLQRSDAGGRVDADLVRQASTERAYWRSVLERVVETIRFLAERGLAFRGSDEVVGSASNGNYLGVIELLAKFDPFLAQHINQHANKGRGHTSYLSKTICDEFINLLGTRVLSQIFTELKSAKYFSVSVDSTPDVSHVDQLTCIIRYVLPSGPVERFVHFLEMDGHSGRQIADALLGFLARHGVDIADCRGQSYDNASNMSGRYIGMQAIIREQNELAAFIPCAAHSLNLVGQAAASCCRLATGFFDFLQKLYAFFVASTSRWQRLTDALRAKGALTVKGLSDTRWSARADATEAVVQAYGEIIEVLEALAENQEQKAETRQEARGLAAYMGHLETGVLAVIWNSILHRFNGCSAALQSSSQDLNTAVAIYESLIEFCGGLRTRFGQFEEQGKALSDCDDYRQDRARRRNRRHDERASAPELVQDPADAFRTGTFLVIIDSITAELRKRLSAYAETAGKFGFFRQLGTLSTEDTISSADRLRAAYPTDLEAGLADELLQFSALLGTKFAQQPMRAGTVDPNTNCHEFTSVSVELRMYRLIVGNDMETVFPNIAIALRMYLCLLISNCSGERSFSKLARIKNQLRSTMGQTRLNMLSVLSVERELLRSIDFAPIISEFADQKSRKHDV